MAQAATLNRASLSQQIRDTLLERIVSGTLQPGDRLIELKIADEMQTSQAPVREALRELEAIGLIETQRNRGARVRVIDADELEEIYLVRAELEALAGELAATRAPEISGKLNRIVAKMIDAAKAGNAKKFAVLNSEFHSTIVEATGNTTLKHSWESLDVRSRTRVNVSRTSSDLIKLARSHVKVAEAIGKGDKKAARRLSWEHVRENRPGRIA